MRRFSSYILTSVSLAAISATPAFAQATTGSPVDATPEVTAQDEQVPPTSEPTNAEGQATSEGDIVVTGSRIRRDNFNTPSPVTVITRNDSVLAGTPSTVETLQNSSVTSGTSQISGGFLGFVSEGGPGTSTVGLRGLGSQRTLLLLNGRRLAPAGVGNQLVAADLNTLPTAVVQRIEVLREGASSVYGSDAIAGVINVITDTKVDGITLDAYGNFPLELDGNAGRTYRASITAGKTFERGHIMGALEYRQLNGVRLNENDDWECPRDLFFQNGVEVGQFDPATGKPRCLPFQFGNGGTASGYGLAFGNGQGGFPFFGRVTFPGYTTDNPMIGAPVIVNDNNLRPSPHPAQFETHVFSPVKTYTGYINGAYELGVLGDAEIYGESLYTRRKSHQEGNVQLNISAGQLGDLFYEMQLYGGHFGATPCEDTFYGTAQCSPFFPTAFSDAGINYFTPLIIPDQLQRESQKVDFSRSNIGLRGNTGLGDWRYDANVQISRTRSRSNLRNPTSQRFANVFQAVIAPDGTPSEFTVDALPGQIGAGNTYTCAANVTNGTYNGGECVPINQYDPNILIGGNLPQGLFDYLYQPNIGHTKFNQDTASLVFDGTILNLPAGPLAAAVGFEHRRDHIDDRPPLAALSGDLYNRAAAGRTVGSDRVNEVFGELNIPILREKPYAHMLEAAVSGRYTKYRSYGSDFTYRINAQYAPIEELRFRASKGTNFRAPNLYEQFVADQTGFFGGETDPCSGFATNFDPNNIIFQNCLTALTGAGLTNDEALAFVNSGSIQVTTRGGQDLLDAEHAKTWGIGAVLTLPRHIADLSIAIDYFNIKVKDEVSTLGTTILDLCYGADDFPNNQYCALIDPRAGPDATRPGIIESFDNPYLNVAQQTAKGVDFNVRYATPLFNGQFQTQLLATRMLAQGLEIFKGAGLFDYNGTLGYPGFGSGPKWVASLDTRYSTGPFTFRWGVEYIGRQNSDIRDLVFPGFINGEEVDIDLEAEPYWEHGVSVQYKWQNVGQITLGVNNLFNQDPPTISNSIDSAGQYFRIGNFFGGGAYDYFGRQVFINLTKTF